MYAYYLQNELNDDKYVRSSRIYSLANDQLQHWITELDRYKMLTESLQVNSYFLLFLDVQQFDCNCIFVVSSFSNFFFQVHLQAGSVHVTKWEKELNLKLESADTARHNIDNSDYRIEELELQLKKCITEKNDLEIKMEEAIQDTGQHIHLFCV